MIPSERRPLAHNQARGKQGEDLAAAWYADRGYEVVARNWRTRQGELDLVMRNGRSYVFCEVKARSTAAFGEPEEAVGRLKRQRIRVLAARWLEEEAGGHARDIRFDVAAVRGTRVDVIEGAF